MPVHPNRVIRSRCSQFFRIQSLALPLALFCSVICTAAGNDGYVLDADTQITLVDGFDAELLYTVPKSEGSWVAMAFDPKGRLIVSDQDDKGIFRVTLPKVDAGTAEAVKVESLKGFPYEPIPWGRRTVGGALGFVYAFDSLYMTTMTGFYRIRDTDGDDQYDQFELLKKLQMGYEHSAHSVIVSEDGKSLYLISGNYGTLPKGIPSLQPPVWREDSLLKSMPDAMGHAVGLKPPGGWICRLSPDGKEWTMIASGFRNCVDLAINREGELFTYDSDLEFDIGSPWYRPTRVVHVTSAGEFGWRAGTAKWPEYFADSNGAVINMGPGSPTGLSFGHHSNFPEQYQDKLFACDWTFGTIYTVEMAEAGSSYVGTRKEFLHGAPLNISAMRFGPDGNMYFLIGGRNSDSKLYRIRYRGPDRKGPGKTLVANQGLRELRHSLEAFHGSRDGGAKAVETAWPYLGHEDRDIRYAARLAIENQDLALWQDRVLAETEARAVIYGCIALCRHGDRPLSGKVLDKLTAIPFGTLATTDQLALLRAYSLCLIRLDAPTVDQKAAIIAALDPFFPAKEETVNTELCRVLSSLDAPNVVEKTIALMQETQAQTLNYDKEMLARHEYGRDILKTMADTPNSQNIQYAYSLRNVRSGWTLASRKIYFGWLHETLTKSGGKSFIGSVRAIRQNAIDNLPPEDSAAIAWLLGDVAAVDLSTLPSASGPAVAWTVDSAAALFENEIRGRDYDNGSKMFAAGRCVACHRFQGAGGYAGPDLGSVGQRFSVRDILVAICDPSASVSEQYQASVVTLKNGQQLSGRIILKSDSEIAVAQNPFNLGELTRKPMAEVEKIEPSPVSMMPPGMIYPMNKDELMDLIAYLVSGGDRKHRFFQK